MMQPVIVFLTHYAKNALLSIELHLHRVLEISVEAEEVDRKHSHFLSLEPEPKSNAPWIRVCGRNAIFTV